MNNLGRTRWMARRLMVVLVIFVLMMPMAAVAESQPFERDVLILFTSDVHCGVDQNFGFAGLQAVRDAARAGGDQVLLVDDGDAVQGEAVGLLTRGEAIIRLMNALEYDVAIPGNHEFDYGMEQFLKLAEMAEFPYISCNFEKDGKTVFEPYLIRQLEGVKVAFVGICTPETLTTSTPFYFQDEEGHFIYGFERGEDGQRLYDAVQRAVDAARAEGADYVIALAHLGNVAASSPYTYADVLEHTTGIDAMLDGHSHDTDRVVVKDAAGREVIRQACGTKMANIGWLRISAEDGAVDTGLYTWGNGMDLPTLMGIDNEAHRQVEQENRAIDDMLDDEVGKSGVHLTTNDPTALDSIGRPLRIIRNAETNLGDFCTDAFRAVSGADVALITGGNLRADIQKGSVTYGDLLSVLPWGNHVDMIEVTGQQLLDALEWGARTVPSENGAFAHVSGLSYEIDTGIESSCTISDEGLCTGIAGQYRVGHVTVGGEPLALDRTYTLVGQDYTLLYHGDGYTAFDGAPLLWEAKDVDFLVLAQYIHEHLDGVIGEEYADPYGQERIVAVQD